KGGRKYRQAFLQSLPQRCSGSPSGYGVRSRLTLGHGIARMHGTIPCLLSYIVTVRPRLKRGTSGMIRYRYSVWDGSQDAFRPAPEDVLDSLADALLQGGDLHKALRMLMQRGMTDRQSRVMPGLQDVLNRLRAMKEQQLRQYDPNRVLDDLRRQLDDIVARE